MPTTQKTNTPDPFTFFDGIEDVKESRNKTYLTEGSYTLEVISMKAIRGDYSKKNYLNTQAKVLTSSGDKATPVGETVTISINVGNPKGLEDVRKLAAAVGKVAFTEVDKQYLGSMVGDDQPAAGSTFRAQAKEITLNDPKGKLPPKPWTTYKFSAAE